MPADGGGSGDATTTGGKEKSKMMELQSALNDLRKVRIPELEMSLQQANLENAKLKLDKVGLDAALTESKRALTNTEATGALTQTIFWRTEKVALLSCTETLVFRKFPNFFF